MKIRLRKFEHTNAALGSTRSERVARVSLVGDSINSHSVFRVHESYQIFENYHNQTFTNMEEKTETTFIKTDLVENSKFELHGWK